MQVDISFYLSESYQTVFVSSYLILLLRAYSSDFTVITLDPALIPKRHCQHCLSLIHRIFSNLYNYIQQNIPSNTIQLWVFSPFKKFILWFCYRALGERFQVFLTNHGYNSCQGISKALRHKEGTAFLYKSQLFPPFIVAMLLYILSSRENLYV